MEGMQSGRHTGEGQDPSREEELSEQGFLGLYCIKFLRHRSSQGTSTGVGSKTLTQKAEIGTLKMSPLVPDSKFLVI